MAGRSDLIASLWRDPRIHNRRCRCGRWIIDTGRERILVDRSGARPGAGGGVTRTTFQIAPEQALVSELGETGAQRPAISSEWSSPILHG